jgi:nucleoside-diphosphate-sugar epimerase
VRVLVTGGVGFIGSHLVRALVGRECEVVVADNLSSTHSLELIADVVDRVEFHHVDVRCPEDLGRLPLGPYDRVFHLAASFANELSVEHPALDARTNLDGTANVLELAARQGCDLFVYTGSSSSYGNVELAMKENGPMQPQTPYARDKLHGEEHVRTSGLPYAIFRLFNVYGPGDIPGRYRNAIPNMMKAVDNDEGRIRILGREATRDFNYIDDVVRYLLEPETAAGETVNVGSGEETLIVDLAHMILDLFGLDRDRLSHEPPRSWDRVSRRVADVQRLHRLYGPRQRLPLAEGLRRTGTWLHRVGRIRRAPR